jgi:UDP-N-acetylglucosamine 2-epimerase (hydrolysing)
MKRICFLSSTRADYGKLKSLMLAVRDAPDFELSVIATGMHLRTEYGSTVNHLKKDGLDPHELVCNRDQAIRSADVTTGVTHWLNELKPDLLVIHGDRAEAHGAALAAASHNVLVAHVEGGEVSGTIDELYRHSITKLSHLHFPANRDAVKRLLQLGEAESSIYEIGSPDIDLMLSDELPRFNDVISRYNLDEWLGVRNYVQPVMNTADFARLLGYGIVLYHPVTTMPVTEIRWRANTLIDELVATGRRYLVLYPNDDSGAEEILEAMLSELPGNRSFALLPSMRFECFLAMLKNTACIVGNSSAGIREAPVYGIPTVNVGPRQQHRGGSPRGSWQVDSERVAGNTDKEGEYCLNVCEKKNHIRQAIETVWGRRFERSTRWGAGNSAGHFMDALRDERLWQTSVQKAFVTRRLKREVDDV